MELKEFITETLTQIVEGVKQAQENLKGTGAIVYPKHMWTNAHGKAVKGHENADNYIDVVEFEVGLTSSEGSERKSKISVLFASIGGALKEKSEVNSVAVTSIKFTIPLVYPTQS